MFLPEGEAEPPVERVGVVQVEEKSVSHAEATLKEWHAINCAETGKRVVGPAPHEPARRLCEGGAPRSLTLKWLLKELNPVHERLR